MARTPETLSAGETAKRMGISERRVRQLCDVGTLTTYDDGTGRLRVRVSGVKLEESRRAKLPPRPEPEPAQEPAPEAGSSLNLADAFARLENLTGQLVAYGERAARAEVRAEMLERQLAEARAELLEQLRAAAPAARPGLFRRRQA